MALLKDVMLKQAAPVSTFNLSRRCRFDAGPGPLIPVLTEELYPGDQVNLSTVGKVFTAPLLAPLMGSFMQEIAYFFVPTRLYVQAMDTNRMMFDPSEVRFPYSFEPTLSSQGFPMNVNGQTGATITPGVNYPFYNTTPDSVKASEVGVGRLSLPEMLNVCQPGYVRIANTGDLETSFGVGGSYDWDSSTHRYTLRSSASAEFQNVADLFSLDSVRPVLDIPFAGYYDIFRNYYANTQEEAFYIVAPPEDATTLLVTEPVRNNCRYVALQFLDDVINGLIAASSTTAVNGHLYTNGTSGQAHFTADSIPNSDMLSQGVGSESGDIVGLPFSFASIWNKLKKDYGLSSLRRGYDLPPLSVLTPVAYPYSGALGSYKPDPQVVRFTYDDTDAGWRIAGGSGNQPPTWAPVYGGLCMRAHRPDLYTAWLSSETYGDMVDSTRINVENGTFTINQIRMGNHLLEYDERGLISGGRYDDWVLGEFNVKTSRNLCIPELLGVQRSDIVFDEVVSTSNETAADSSDVTGLGDLGGKGTGYLNGAPIRFTATEHGFLMAIYSIVPNVSYAPARRRFYDRLTFQDLYAPKLDHIGFQPLLGENVTTGFTRFGTGPEAVNGAVNLPYIGTTEAVGYQPAYVELTTAVDEVHGSLVPGGELDFWAITRDFQPYQIRTPQQLRQGEIPANMANFTSYILPNQFNYPFVDQRADAQNFFVQLGFNLRMRREKSKNPMPTLA